MPPSFQKGFTLLLSILVISMILSASLGMAQIALKENQLSSLVRESESAFHAADKGIDCALFYHISYDRQPLPNGTYTAMAYSPFATSTVGPGPFPPGVGYQYPNMSASAAADEMSLVTCDGTTRLDSIWTVSNPAPALTSGLTEFHLDFTDGSCVDVRVLNTNGGTNSTITSEGYNTCVTTSPNRTLRVIEVSTNI